MQVGVVFPQTEAGTDVGLIRAYFQDVEGLGYSHALFYDHVAGLHPRQLASLPSIPYTHESLFHEVFVVMGWAAALTSRLGLMCAVLILPQRQTVLVAKQAAEVDLLSGGRLRVGVGSGWNFGEYAALGAPWRRRGRLLDEQVRLLRALWTEPLVTLTGEFHQLEETGINPLPVQRPIPIWFGGDSDAAVRRTARLGDGWIPMLNPLVGSQAGPREAIDRMQALVREAGRDPSELGIEGRANYRGSAEDVLRAARAWRDLGATHFSINTMGAQLHGLGDHLRVLGELRHALDELWDVPSPAAAVQGRML